MYIGARTDAAPMPIPPTKRDSIKTYQFSAIAQPIAESRNKTPVIFKESLLPQRSPGIEPNIAPTIVPTRAIATVQPREIFVSWNLASRLDVTPDITAVSKPNKRPAQEIKAALKNNGFVKFIIFSKRKNFNTKETELKTFLKISLYAVRY